MVGSIRDVSSKIYPYVRGCKAKLTILSRDNVNMKRTFPYQIVDKTNNTATNCLSRCSKFGFGAGGMTYSEECCKLILSEIYRLAL